MISAPPPAKPDVQISRIRLSSRWFITLWILHEEGLLICGIYVDLNQIRAGEALTPESSLHCSVGWRIAALLSTTPADGTVSRATDWLAPLTLEKDQLGDVPCRSGQRASDKGLWRMSLDECLQLLDWIGRQQRADKRGAIPAALSPILERLKIDSDQLVETVAKMTQRFRRMIGPVEDMAARATEAGRKWFQGQRQAARIFRVAGGEGKA